MRLILLLFAINFFSCTEKKPKTGEQTLDFGSFTIEVPSSWTEIEVKGIDSYVGQIAIDSSDTLHFDLGWYSNKLSGHEVRDSVTWDTINGYRSKIVFPKQTGIGITGIYIDSLWQGGSDVDKFNLAGYNLKPPNEKLLLKAIKTLKFHNKE